MAQSSAARINQIDPSLYLITLPIPLAGFDDFIGCWVSTGDPTIIVDAGPMVSASALLAALAELGVRQPELILLTHIHVDHAGGMGRVARQFPKAAVVCHPKSVEHLLDPQKLWQGTLSTLGPKLAQTYQPFEPLSAKVILPADQLRAVQIRALPTPGHAAHHYSYLLDNRLLFVGEAAGIYLPMTQPDLYLRPATPPRFFMETYLQSLDRLIALNPQAVCYGHLGIGRDPGAWFKLHREQILRWKEWITPWFERSQKDPQGSLEACVEELLGLDPLLAGYRFLPTAIQQRERGFMGNAVKGYFGYLASEP